MSVPVSVDGHSLTLEKVNQVANLKAEVVIDESVWDKVNKSRDMVEEIVKEGKVVYGINTGFGSLKHKQIKQEDAEQLQINLIRSHAIGVGAPLYENLVRAIMLVRLNSLIQGNSGIRPIIAETLAQMLNKGVYPWIPEKGSVGSSGDLVPLSHMTLVMMGEGKAFLDGMLVDGETAMKFLGIEPVKLSYKEGLALNNGTAAMTGIAAITLIIAQNIARSADVIGAMSTEATMGTKTAFRSEIHTLRPHAGQIASADNLYRLCDGSQIMESHKCCDRVQDCYSIRCMPQIHGGCREAISYVIKVVETELNSVTDNPLLFTVTGEVLSCGNFHGEPVAIACDTLGIALAEFGDVSERRTAKIVDDKNNEGLPPYLIPKGDYQGLNSGFMIPQYTAAALVSENKVLAHPASVDSIPTSANQEDHVSMGTIAARKAYTIAQNVRDILAIEAMTAAQALEFRAPLKPGKGADAAYKLIRSKVPSLIQDRVMGDDLNEIKDMIVSGRLVDVAEDVIGTIH